MIAPPTDIAAMSCARCNGSAVSGNTESRPYMRLSQSSRLPRIALVARRRRSRKVSARRRRVRRGWSQRWQQTKRQRSPDESCQCRQCRVIELLAIEADGVGRSDKYTKVYRHRREYCCRRWLRHQRPGRHQNQAKYEGEGAESFEVRQQREFDEPCES